MATLQTELKFNVRKKRVGHYKDECGKENAGGGNVRILHAPAGIGGEKLINKFSTDCSDSDSDDDCSTVKRSAQHIKRLLLLDDEDKCQEKNDVSPPKRGRNHANEDVTTPSKHVAHQRSKMSSSSTEKCEVEKRVSQIQPFSSGSRYQLVRQALQSSDRIAMPGREEQLNKLHTFLDERLSAGRSDTLYISGPPGTGKTACLSKLMDVPKFKNGYKVVNVNCTCIKSSGAIYKRIAQELALRVHKQTEKEYLLSIQQHLASNHKMILLVLDEIDQLDSRKQSVLYTIFEWPSKPNSRLVLIGIANALDLTDRILPRLQARLDLKPSLLHFPPYTKLQIVNILTERIKQSGVSGVFPQVALELLAGKVASTCGDVRRAIDIARRAVEIAEAQSPDAPLPLQPSADYGNRLTARKSPQKTGKVLTAGCVTLKHVMAVMNGVYSTSQSLAAHNEDSFPLQQKILVATLLSIIKRGCSKDVTVGKLHEAYRRVCNKRNLLAVDQCEFVSLCKLVETRGILRMQERKDARLSKVCLQWDEEEVSSTLKDRQLVASILNDM